MSLTTFEYYKLGETVVSVNEGCHYLPELQPLLLPVCRCLECSLLCVICSRP